MNKGADTAFGLTAFNTKKSYECVHTFDKLLKVEAVQPESRFKSNLIVD